MVNLNINNVMFDSIRQLLPSVLQCNMCKLADNWIDQC